VTSATAPGPVDQVSVDVVAQQPAPAQPGAERPRRRRGLVPALAAITLAGVGASVYLALDGPGARPPVDATAEARAAAVAAASQEITNFTTYDYRTIKGDFARVSDLATGGFASDFRTGAADLEKLIVAGKATSKGVVVAAGAESFSPAHAVVLLAVDDTVKNAKVPKGTVRRYRFSVTVDLVGNRWLVSALRPVS
jgi:Mce-associated membrane protein